MMTLAIYCAGGLGKEVLALALSVNIWDSIILVDDITNEEWYQGAKIFKFDSIKDYPDEIEFVIANGEPEVRETLYNKVKNSGYKLTKIVGPYCDILPGSIIGEGCIIYDCGISADVIIGDNVLINGRVIIGHNAEIGNHSVISSSSFIGGCTKIGQKVYLGPGAMIKDRIMIGNSSIISLGAVILRNVRERAIMIGNPAKRIGYNTEGKVFGIFD